MSNAANLLGGDPGGADPNAQPGGDPGAQGGGDPNAGGNEGGDTNQGGDPWFAGLSAEAAEGALSDRAWAENKGYKSLPDAIAAFRGLEQKIGAGRFNVPKDENDSAGWEAAYKALGRPDAPTDYKIELPDGADAKFAEAFAGIAHGAGLNQRQVNDLVKWNQEMVAAAQEASEQAFEQQATADIDALKGDWKDKFDANMEIGRRAAVQLGFDQSKLDRLERALGTRGLLELMHDLGKKVGEDTMDGGGRQNMGGLTGQQAAEQKKVKMADPEFVKKLNAKDPQAVAEWDRINAALAAELDRAQAA